MATHNSGLTQVVLKVASRCNLNCSYCYVYNKADSTWKGKPPFMSDEIFDAAIKRTRDYCDRIGQKTVRLGFHGGEPCLVGPERLRKWCLAARQLLGHLELQINIQTNGTLLDEQWIRVFRDCGIDVGISLDGPKEVHDAVRQDHAGRGSYDSVLRGLKLLKNGNVRHGILSVIKLGADPIAVHRHLASLGCSRVTYILPDFTHDTINEIHERYGDTPCADFLIGVFDEWWFNGTLEVQVADLWNMARVVLGGESIIETIGNKPSCFVFVESDGEIEGLDSLRVCKEGLSKIGLNVLTNGFEQVANSVGMHATAIFKGMPLPRDCHGCVEEQTCAGGYLPHRYSSDLGFDNRTVWCADMLKLFAHVRRRLDVTPQETIARRQAILDTKLEIRRETLPTFNLLTQVFGLSKRD
jgi:uncharacterized protein